MVDGGNGSASEGLGERVELHHGHDIDGYVELGRPDGHHRVCHRVEYAEQRRTGGHARQKENATEHRGELFVLVTNDRRAVKVEQDGERDYVDCRKRYVVLYSRALVRNETAQQKNTHVPKPTRERCQTRQRMDHRPPAHSSCIRTTPWKRLLPKL
mmetsp:Transcript_13045/g.20707  ORF Transcript_13045/g.20707 Transcript_13045/m.20707 type:complete len:156 (-) Transcript_13045:616-1083(-)